MAGRKTNFLLVFSLVFILGACSSAGRKARKSFRVKISKGDFKAGLEALKNKSIIEDKKSRILLYLEEARTLHALGLYQASNRLLYLAKSMREQAYKRISQKLGSLVGNDNNQDYVGSLYEYSHLYFYLVLNHFMISQTGEQKAFVFPEHEKLIKPVEQKTLSKKEVRAEIFRARANLLAWDSMLKSYKDDRLGKSVFKYDLLAKVFGGFVHEAIGTRSDQNIALKLYEKGVEVLERNYNGYPTFNKLFKKFNKDFAKFPRLGMAAVRKNYVEVNQYHKELQDLLVFKILSLTKKLRPGSLQKKIAKYRPSSAVKKKLKTKNQHQVCLIFQESLIPEMIADKYDIGLESAIKNSPSGAKSFVANIGLRVLANFAATELGLIPQGRNSPGAAFGVGLSAVAAYKAAISFELPKMDRRPNVDNFILIVKNQQGQKVKQVPVAIVNPIGDLAVEMVEKEAVTNYAKIGTRVALKYASAIAATYLTYKAINKKSKDGFALFAKGAAVLQFLGLYKAIEKSEKADIRYWSSLPNSVQMAFVNLKKGKYKLTLKKMRNQSVLKSYELDDLDISKDKKNYLVNFSSVD